MEWIVLKSEEDLESAIKASFTTPSAIFKHSTRCPVSFMAKRQLEGAWNFDESTAKAYFLDLIAFRKVSNRASELAGVVHESPQLLLFKNGKLVYDASHGAIAVEEIQRAISDFA